MRPLARLPLITRVIACLLVIGWTAASSSLAGDAPRPTLQVWTADWCPPCHTFWRDYRNDLSFRQWIDDRFTLRTIDFDKFHAEAVQLDVDSVPTYQVFAPAEKSPRLTIEGYLGPQHLMQRLDQRAVGSGAGESDPVPRAGEAPVAPTNTDQLRRDLAAALAKEIAQAEARLRETRETQLSHVHRDLLARLEALAARVQSTEETTPAALAQLRAELHALVQQQPAAAPAAGEPDPAPRVGEAPAEPPRTGSIFSRGLSLLGVSLSVAQWLGVAGVTGGAVPLAWGLLTLGKRLFSRRRKARAARNSSVSDSRGDNRYVDLDRSDSSLSLPELHARLKRVKVELGAERNRTRALQERLDNLRKQACQTRASDSPAQPTASPAQPPRATDSPLYAPYETAIFREAYEESCRMMARKYPGAIDTLDRLKDFINQYLSSKGHPPC